MGLEQVAGKEEKPALSEKEAAVVNFFNKCILGWLSKNFDRQVVVVSRARDHTRSMSSVWEITTTQDIGTFYDAIASISITL